MITAIGLDAGTSGKSAISVLQGNDWSKVHCVALEAAQSIAAPDLEALLVRYCEHYNPQIVVMEENGPGAVFAGYIERNQPSIPLATVNTQLALPEDYELILWNDIRINTAELLNVRAAMCWILRLLFQDRRIELWFDDEELIAQLGTLRWDHDNARGDKIFMVSKRKLRFKSSELDTEPFSKSPDKADSLALASLGYAILMQQDLPETLTGEASQEQDIIDPVIEGMFAVDDLTTEMEQNEHSS